MKAHGVVKREEEEPETGEGAATNVVDFMSLLQQSIDRNKRTPAKKAAVKAATAKATAKAAPARKTAKKATKKATRKAPAKASTRKRA
jgi:DNA end-binding protein Ku